MSAGAVQSIIRAILTDTDMPRARYQDPKIQQSKNGCYFIRPWVDVLTKEGLKRKKKTIVLGPSQLGKRGALAKKNEVMRTVNRADYMVQSQIQFDFLLNEYLTNHVRAVDELARSTREKYEAQIKNHIGPAFGGLKLCEITTSRVSAWLQEKARDGHSSATRVTLRNTLSGIFTKAIEWGYWHERNPVQYASAGKKRPHWEHRKLTDDQIRKLLAELPFPIRVMCMTGLFCTLRVSEMLGLQEKHLDFDNGLIQVRQRFYRGDIDVPKNPKSRRDVPMGSLKEFLAKLCLGEPERFVFQMQTQPRKGSHSYSGVAVCRDDRDLNQHFLRPAAKKVGVYYPGFGFHAFRREAITELRRHLDLRTVQYLSGHSSTQMTDLYTLYDAEYETQLAKEAYEKVFGEGKPGAIQ